MTQNNWKHYEEEGHNAWLQAVAAKQMRTALFWATTQRVVVIPFRRFGTTHRPTGPIGCPETSGSKCRYSLRNNREERSSQGTLRLYPFLYRPIGMRYFIGFPWWHLKRDARTGLQFPILAHPTVWLRSTFIWKSDIGPPLHNPQRKT